MITLYSGTEHHFKISEGDMPTLFMLKINKVKFPNISFDQRARCIEYHHYYCVSNFIVFGEMAQNDHRISALFKLFKELIDWFLYCLVQPTNQQTHIKNI